VALIPDLRAAVYLKRMALALERSAKAHEEMARIAVDDWSRRHVKHPVSKVELGVADISEINKQYLERLEKEALGEFEEESE
jgi:hypothetical protein